METTDTYVHWKLCLIPRSVSRIENLLVRETCQRFYFNIQGFQHKSVDTVYSINRQNNSELST